MSRSAQRWAVDVLKPRTELADHLQDYHELKYEDLLGDTQGTLEELCRFLDLSFDARMLTLSHSAEHRGEAAGQLTVKQDNKGKYERQMPPRIQCRMERIAAHQLRVLGYPIAYDGPPVPVPAWQMFCYRMGDILPNILSRRRDHGLLGAAKLVWRLFRITYR